MRKELADTVSKTQSTPPQYIIAVSPGSASQNLRRKAIHEGLEGQVKRARLSFDDPVSSSQSAVDSTITTPVKIRILSDATEACGKSDDADVPTPNSDANGSHRSAKNSVGSNAAASSASQCSDQDELQVASDPYVREFAETCGDDLAATVLDYDEKDKITTVRCRKCGYEMWTIWMTQIGICTHCDDQNPPSFPYYEIIDDEAGPRPGIEPSEMARILRGSDRKNIVGDYLDDHSDAYDSVDDEEQGCRSEYDSEDSFVDDASIDESQPGRKSGDSSSESKNTCYGALFEEFQPKYRRLVNRLEDMVGDFVSGDENASDGDDLYDPVIEGIDEYGAAAVDLVAPKPAISELVLSLAQQQSQESELSGDRIWDRVKAFEAAAGENWNQISMVSTGDNHTNAETGL
jgi:hypothetical protein